MGPEIDAITEFCQRNHITRMLTYTHPHRIGDEKGNTVDVLVDFAPGHTPGYFDMSGGPGLIGMEEELAELFGKKYGYIMSFDGIGPHFRSKDLDDARAIAKPVYPLPKAE